MIVVGGEALVDLVIDPDGARHCQVGWRAFQRGQDDRSTGQRGRLPRRASRAIGSARCCIVSCWPTRSTIRWSSSPSCRRLGVGRARRHGSASYHFYLAETAAPNLYLLAVARPTSSILHVGTLGMVLEPMATTLEAIVEQHRRRCAGAARSELPTTGHRRSGRIHGSAGSNVAACRCRQGQH